MSTYVYYAFLPVTMCGNCYTSLEYRIIVMTVIMIKTNELRESLWAAF